MDLYLQLVALACVVSAACGGSVFACEPGRGANRISALLFLGAAYWAICELVWNQADDAAAAVRWMRASAPGWCFIGPVVLHLFLSTAQEPWPRLKRLVPVLYATCTGLTLAALSTPWVMASAVRTSWGWAFETGPLFPAFYAVTMVGVVSGLVVIRTTLREFGSPAERRQQPWILAGAGIPIVTASMTDAVLPVFGVQLPRLGTTSFAMLGGVAVWLVLRFGHSFLTPGTFANEILSTLPDGVALLHRDGRIRTPNDGLARLSGHSRTRLAGMRVTNLVSRVPEDVGSSDGELLRADGERVPVAIATSLLCDRQGYSVGHVLVVRDLREVADLRRRLVMAARLAAVGELAAGIAHEINNPIAFVRANLNQLQAHWKTVRDALADRMDDPGLRGVVDEGDELVEECVEGVDRTVEIVRGVKGFSHSGSGEREEASVNQLLDDVLRVARSQLRSHARIECLYGDVPSVRCDPQELKQVFLNLLVNAGQAIAEGGTIRLRTAYDRDAVIVHVEDDGAGIEPGIIDRIFDPFFTTKKVGEGTGLGLGIAYEIVRRHGGEIAVDSTPGRGTRFRVRLPV